MGNNHHMLKETLQWLSKIRLIDDELMTKFFENNIECTELVVQIVLERTDIKVQQVHTQHHIKNLQGRSVILDIHAVDGEGKQYNIEIQRSDQGAIPKRARFHSSVLDSNSLEAKQDYSQLPETYVIFITEHDVLKGNLPIYHIDRTVRETGECFGDEAHIIYVNGEYKDDTPLGLLMKDFFCTKPEDMHYQQLADRLRYFKEEKEGVEEMSELMEAMCNEVGKRMVKEMAQKLLKGENMSCEKVSEYSNLPLEEVREMAKEIQVCH